MNEEFESLLDLLQESEVELDAWKDMKPDVAGATTLLLERIRAKLNHYRPEPNFDQQETTKP